MQPSKFEFILIEGSAGASYALRLEGKVLKYLRTPPDHKEQGFGLDRIHRFTPSEGEQRELVVSQEKWQTFYQDIDDLENIFDVFQDVELDYDFFNEEPQNDEI